MADKHGSNFQSDVLKHRIDDESLVHCLEYCTQYLETKEDQTMLELWYMIGTQGPGILYEDLVEILGDEEREAEFKELEKQIKESDSDEAPAAQSKLEKNLEDLI